MNAKRYIGGAFAADDSKPFYGPIGDWAQYFPKTLGGLQRYDFETGTDALAACIIQLRLGTDRPLFIPLHYCAETLNRLRTKCPAITIRRYARLADIPDSPACVLWNHFNGYSTPPQALFECQNWLIIEDYVQAAFSLPLIKGIAAFTSLRKWSEIDYAFLYIASLDKPADNTQSAYFKAKKQAENDKAGWGKTGGDVVEQRYLHGFQLAEQALNTPSIYQASQSQITRLETISWSGILAQRQANADFLLAGLSTLPITILGNHALFSMIQVDNRDNIRKFLAANGVFAPVHWLDSSDIPLANSLLSLPIDHRYTCDDMQRILTLLNHAINR